MEYFKSGLKTVLGTPDVEDQPSGADIVCYFKSIMSQLINTYHLYILCNLNIMHNICMCFYLFLVFCFNWLYFDLPIG